MDDIVYRKGEDAVYEEFAGAVVMTRYGQNRTYKVDSIRFDMNPKSHTFVQGEQGTKINMLQYFKKQYGIERMNPNQPLLEIKQKRGTIYLPTELCTMVGIPTNVREDFRAMSEIKKSIFLNPTQKIQNITELSRMIAKSTIAKDWDLQLNVDPDQIEAKILPRPSIINPQSSSASGSGVISLEENHKKTLGTVVHEPLFFKKWVVFCIDQDLENAKWLQDQMYSAAKQYGTGIEVEYAEDFVALRTGSKSQDFVQAIDQYYKRKVAPDLDA